MVRFVTTAYTYMYENSYVGLPEEQFRKKDPNELTPVGVRVERWRKHANLKVSGVVKAANELLSKEQKIDSEIYWEFIRGQRRITEYQIRAIAKVFGTTVHIMTHYLPGHVPVEEQAKPKRVGRIRVTEPAKRSDRKRKSQGAPKRKTKPVEKVYDVDDAARILAEKYRVTRTK